MELFKLVEFLYSKLILRDFFGKIIPGIIPLTGLSFGFGFTTGNIQNLNSWIWIILIGFSWIIGFSIQGIGEVTGWIRYYPIVVEKVPWEKIVEYPMNDEILNGTCATKIEEKTLMDIQRRKDKGDSNWIAISKDFDQFATGGQSQGQERLVIIKEACGNGYLAVSALILILLLQQAFNGFKILRQISLSTICDKFEFDFDILSVFVFLVVAVWSLRKMHFIHVNRQFRFTMSVLKDSSKFSSRPMVCRY